MGAVPQPVAKLEPAAVGGRATPEVALGVGRGTPEVALGVERLQSPSSELETDGLDATVWKALQGKGSGECFLASHSNEVHLCFSHSHKKYQANLNLRLQRGQHKVSYSSG